MRMLRVLPLGIVGALVAWLLGRWAVRLAVAVPDRVEDVIALGGAATGAVVAAWYALTAVTLLLAEVAGAGRRTVRLAARLRTTVARLGPPVLRRVAMAGVGAGLAIGGGPATAGTPDAVPHDLRPGLTSVAEQVPAEPVPPSVPLSPPPAPAAPSSPPSAAAPPTAEPGTGEPAAAQRPAVRAEVHVVRRGDSLWSIAAGRLGTSATDAEIAAEWPRWYAANRAVVGADPDLIHPGQTLQAPDPKDAS